MKQLFSRMSLLCAFLFFVGFSTQSHANSLHDVYVIHFVLDGLPYEVLNEALKTGETPNLKKLIVDRGAFFTNALAPFPSTSPTSYQSFVTGLFPGSAGIPHLERFDRDQKEAIGYLELSGYQQINHDLINLRALEDPDIANASAPTTLFELLKGHQTASIYSSFYRGASEIYPKFPPLGAAWSAHISRNEKRLDKLAMKRVFKLFKRSAKRIPRYTLVALLGADLAGHRYGPKSQNVREIVSHFDAQLGTFFSLLEKREIREKTYVIVSSDHGMHESGKHFKLGDYLKDQEFLLKPQNPRNKNYTLYVTERGVSSTQIYAATAHSPISWEPLEKADHLREHPTSSGQESDLIASLLAHEATDMIAIRDGHDQVVVLNQRGAKGVIGCTRVRGELFCNYQSKGSDKTRDPFGYCTQAKLAEYCSGKAFSSHAWREATASSEFPDAVIQIAQLFQTPRTGDVIVMAHPSWSLKKAKKGTHGLLIREDTHIPLMITGPNIPHGIFGTARTVDLYPQILSWFGLDHMNMRHDGYSLFSPHVEDPLLQELAKLDLFLRQHLPLQKMIGVPQFVKEEVSKQIPLHRFTTLKPTAEKELLRRSELAQQLGGGEKWIAEKVRADLRRMDDIVGLLNACANPNSLSCQSL